MGQLRGHYSRYGLAAKSRPRPITMEWMKARPRFTVFIHRFLERRWALGGLQTYLPGPTPNAPNPGHLVPLELLGIAGIAGVPWIYSSCAFNMTFMIMNDNSILVTRVDMCNIHMLWSFMIIPQPV
jgi:hypothetical protein